MPFSQSEKFGTFELDGAWRHRRRSLCQRLVVVTFVSVLFKISCTKRQSRCCTFCSQIISLWRINRLWCFLDNYFVNWTEKIGWHLINERSEWEWGRTGNRKRREREWRRTGIEKGEWRNTEKEKGEIKETKCEMLDNVNKREGMLHRKK